GRLTDGQGRTVDFRNTVIILTSNIGSQYFAADPLSASDNFSETRAKVLDEIRLYLRPEFINRLDEILVFHSLGVSEIKRIVQIQLRFLSARLAERRIELHLTDE